MDHSTISKWPAICLALAVTACGSSSQPAPGDIEPYNGIGEAEMISLLGTEPFWGAKISGATMTYTTPDNIEGVEIQVARFAGNGGLGFHSQLDGQAVTVAVTPGDCTDGMSDRTYPFTATVKVGDTDLAGCGYTDNQPFTGNAAP